MKKQILQKQDHYKAIYKSIVVTYLDGSTKTFTPSDWALFEKRIKAMKTKSIEIIRK